MMAVALISALVLAQLDSRSVAPDTITIAIVDVSPSMEGSRLETAKKELVQYIEQLPPSPRNAFVLVTFSDSAHAPRGYSDLQQAIRDVEALTVQGQGTNIASGLKQGRLVGTKYLRSPNLLILLYSDGEDSNPDAVLREEALLSQIFAQRRTLGLSNHVSLKRWGNANARLLTQLKGDQNVSVTDAGEMRIVPIGIHPAIRLVSAQRTKDNPRSLSVEFESALSVKSDQVEAWAEAVCDDPRVTGDTRFELRPSTAPRKHKLTVLPTDADEAKGAVAVAFKLTPRFRASAGGNEIVLPVVSSSSLRLTIPIPKVIVQSKVTARLGVCKAVGWREPLDSTVIVSAEVIVNRDDQQESHSVERTLALQIKGRGGCRTSSPLTDPLVKSPGETTLICEFDVPLPPNATTCDLSFEIIPMSLSPLLDVGPASVQLNERDIALPEPVQVPINFTVESHSVARWVRLPSLSLFTAQIRVHVDGPIPPNTSLVVAAPADVRSLLIQPSTIRTGEQTLQIACWASLAPAPKVTQLPLTLSTSSRLSAYVEFKPTAPLVLSPIGPRPLKIVHADARRLEQHVADTADVAIVNLRPIIEGIADERIASGIEVQFEYPNSAAATSAPLYSDHQLVIDLPRVQQGWFESLQHEVPIALGPAVPTPALERSTATIRIHKRSPFVRFFIYVATAMAPTITLLLILWVIRRFRSDTSTLGGDLR